MPHKAWRHRCAHWGEELEVLRGSEICFYCGRKGVRDGWDYSMIEQMGMYQLGTGLPPIGAHRKYIDSIHHHIFDRCGYCDGRGLIDIDGESYRKCENCNGTGYVILVSKAEMRQIRLRAKAIFEKKSGRKYPLKIY
jgi:RecJ-like exonuclease